MILLIASDFQTGLGIVRTWLETVGDTSAAGSGLCQDVTAHYQIKLELIGLKNEWLPKGMHVEYSCGWRWRIKKSSAAQMRLILYCRLVDPMPTCRWGCTSGERLDAIEIEDGTCQVSIGTEDGDVQSARAARGDEMPKRFEKQLGYRGNDYLSFTEPIDFGFKTIIPDLFQDEEVYFHFLVATNPIRPGVQNPDEHDVSTWFAVDQDKGFLDQLS